MLSRDAGPQVVIKRLQPAQMPAQGRRASTATRWLLQNWMLCSSEWRSNTPSGPANQEKDGELQLVGACCKASKNSVTLTDLLNGTGPPCSASRL